MYSSWDPPETDDRRVLRLSNDDRVIAGVCGGVGRYLGIDPVVVRVAAIVLTIAGGAGILAYLAAMFLVPRERPGDNVGPTRRGGRPDTGRLVAGGLLVAAGMLLLLNRIIPWVGRLFWPVVVVAVGVAIVLTALRR